MQEVAEKQLAKEQQEYDSEQLSNYRIPRLLFLSPGIPDEHLLETFQYGATRPGTASLRATIPVAVRPGAPKPGTISSTTVEGNPCNPRPSSSETLPVVWSPS